ncbi:MAG: hypothetical protein E7649_07565 [Ruminococcaceae bacterium]|nr:hypothetical protein [Oscillospiraceae bacterium]
MASRSRRFFLNGVTLTATALVMRLVSVIFNAYISNHAGSEAMGLFSLLGSVYALSITVATAGINLGTTRLVSDALGKGDASLAKRCARRALLCCTVTGAFASVLLFSLSKPIALHALSDSRAIPSLRCLAITLVPIAVCSCLSGYFTAVRRVKVNAAFGIVSQFVKIGATMLLLSSFASTDTETVCVMLVLGGAAAEFFSLIVTFLLYLFDVKLKLKSDDAGKENNNDQGIIKKLLSITLPVTVSACIRSALSTFQHILIPRGIHKSGQSWSAALSSYGALHGMALPLLLFPSAFIYSFAGILIPEISECCVLGDEARLKRVSYRALTMSLFFSIGISGIMIFFSRELGMLIYNNAETALYIRVLAPLIPVMYIDGTVDAILKGSGHQVYSMNVNIADTLTACVFALTLIPSLGIWGYVISIYATEILNTTLSLIKMLSVSKMKPRVLHQVFMPILCIIGSTQISRLLLFISPFNMSAVLELILNVAFTVALYVALLLLTRTLDKDEFELLNASLMTEKQYEVKIRTPYLIESSNRA